MPEHGMQFTSSFWLELHWRSAIQDTACSCPYHELVAAALTTTPGLIIQANESNPMIPGAAFNLWQIQQDPQDFVMRVTHQLTLAPETCKSQKTCAGTFQGSLDCQNMDMMTVAGWPTAT